ncbi:MAG: MoxR family ATPase, partial [Bdellovibrionales bacterium]|nr:MoxR family ATPase [Bdellovibrionales bacterium]
MRDATGTSASHSQTSAEVMAEVDAFANTFQAIEREVGRAIVGMEDIVRKTLTAIFAGGHVLLEGAPGLGKTLLVKSIAQTMGLSFHRIQFTSDLMP